MIGCSRFIVILFIMMVWKRSITLNINGLSAGVKSVIYYVGKEPIELWTTPFNSWWMGAAGIFQLTEGYVKLVLHDDGLKNNEVLMADAVKWVRIE